MSINSNKLNIYFLILIAAWTILSYSNISNQIKNYEAGIINIATKEADLAYTKDSLYRKWVSMHGGIYVKVSEKLEPNPYLSFIENRDIVTKDGEVLTLVNPAYMTRMVFELGGADSIQGHLTSENLYNPINAPDEWEKKALKAIMQTGEPYAEKSYMNDKLYLRFMRPFVTEEGCLKCHSMQGYKLGDIRGGISVDVPLDVYYKAFDKEMENIWRHNIMVWLFGAVILAIIYFKFRKLLLQEESYGIAKELMLKELNHRVKNNLQIISSIIDFELTNTPEGEGQVLKEIRSRLSAMASMHKIFKVDDLSIGVDAAEYVKTLCDQFMQSNNSHNLRVEVVCDVDGFVLSAPKALSCGLILNELLTNSYKYAFSYLSIFPKVEVSLKKTGRKAVLTYRDNGSGFDTKAAAESGSYGMLLIESMAEKLGGRLSVNGAEGAHITLEFEI
jgi:two-component sensor histidine kinase